MYDPHLVAFSAAVRMTDAIMALGRLICEVTHVGSQTSRKSAEAQSGKQGRNHN